MAEEYDENIDDANDDDSDDDLLRQSFSSLDEGVALPRAAPDRVSDPEIAAFLKDWAEAHPGQVVEGGPI